MVRSCAEDKAMIHTRLLKKEEKKTFIKYVPNTILLNWKKKEKTLMTRVGNELKIKGIKFDEYF